MNKIIMIRLKNSEDGITIYENGKGCELEQVKELPGVMVILPHANPFLVPYSNISKVFYEKPTECKEIKKQAKNENTSHRG